MLETDPETRPDNSLKTQPTTAVSKILKRNEQVGTSYATLELCTPNNGWRGRGTSRNKHNQRRPHHVIKEQMFLNDFNTQDFKRFYLMNL